MARITKKESAISYLLTIPRNRARVSKMLPLFPHEIFRVFNGVDGQRWSKYTPTQEVPFDWVEEYEPGVKNMALMDKGATDRALESWIQEKKAGLVWSGVLSSEAKLCPGQVGCALTHLYAWNTFLRSGREWGIFIEDDLLPGPLLDCTIWEGICRQMEGEEEDHIMLCEEIIGVTPEGRCAGLMGTQAYAFSKEGARKAIRCLQPLYTAIDNQLYGILYGTECFERPTEREFPPEEPMYPAVTEGLLSVDWYELQRSSIWMNDRK